MSQSREFAVVHFRDSKVSLIDCRDTSVQNIMRGLTPEGITLAVVLEKMAEYDFSLFNGVTPAGMK